MALYSARVSRRAGAMPGGHHAAGSRGAASRRHAGRPAVPAPPAPVCPLGTPVEQAARAQPIMSASPPAARLLARSKAALTWSSAVGERNGITPRRFCAMKAASLLPREPHAARLTEAARWSEGDAPACGWRRRLDVAPQRQIAH